VDVHVDGGFSKHGEFRLQFKVEDSGTGIPADKLALIFDKFTQADGSVSRKYGGTGLGLAITRKLVEMHGGEIDVASEVGQGTTFVVKLPCDIAIDEAGKCKSIEQSSAAPADGPLSLVRILVVEDNQVNQKVVTTVLRKRGFSIEVAGDGTEALAKLEKSPGFDLILMDVQMPDMDGIETTAVIREREKSAGGHMPIVALTAHAMGGDRERCIEAGMDNYVNKPIDAVKLLEVVESTALAHAPSTGGAQAVGE
jgi:CheY-like chemotaxis protein